MIRAFIQERAGCKCWYCTRRRNERDLKPANAPIVVQPEPEWRPADGASP